MTATTNEARFEEYEERLTQVRKGKEWIDIANKYGWELGRLDPRKALKIALEAREDAFLFRYKIGKAAAFRNLAQCYRLLSDYDLSLEMCLEAIKSCEENTVLRAQVVNLLGAVYVHEADYENALIYYNECLKINEFHENEVDATKVKNSIGDLYLRSGNYEKALEYFQDCMRSEGIDQMFEGIVKYNVGEVLFYLKKNDEARAYLKEAVAIGNQLSFNLMTVYCASLEGEIYLSEENYDAAVACLNEALEVAILVDAKERSYRIYKLLSKCCKLKGDYENALLNYECFHKMKEEVFNDDKNKKIKNLQFQYESESLRREAELERTKNAEITEAYDQIDAQNQKIIASINYAKRIQQAILPPDKTVKSCLPESFVLYDPKDIVSGDFYWLQEVDDWVFWAVVDCTGHGVPGALMSMIGANGLQKIVLDHNVKEPAEILKQLTHHVMNSIQQTTEGIDVKDGMDIALCAWNRKTNQLKFSGAYNPLYLIRDGEIQIIKGTKRPIGKFYVEIPIEYEQHEIQLNKGDIVITFTDGYADQFGGERSLKYSYRRLRELLVENANLPLVKCKAALEQAHLEWKGGESQIDDICVMGVRF